MCYVITINHRLTLTHPPELAPAAPVTPIASHCSVDCDEDVLIIMNTEKAVRSVLMF